MFFGKRSNAVVGIQAVGMKPVGVNQLLLFRLRRQNSDFKMRGLAFFSVADSVFYGDFDRINPGSQPVGIDGDPKGVPLFFRSVKAAAVQFKKRIGKKPGSGSFYIFITVFVGGQLRGHMPDPPQGDAVCRR